MRHEGEVETSPELVRRLLAAQFPDWAELPVTQLPVGGTDHTLYRIGEDLLARMPRIGGAADQADSDQRWLPLLAPQLPLAVPAPVGLGEPGEDLPWQWTVVPWLAGENPTADNLDLEQAAVDLAGFVTSLAACDPAGGPIKDGTSRGAPLAARDELTRGAIDELGDRVDSRVVGAVWAQALEADPWTAPGVWLHGDLLSGNLLAKDRRLTAVIDFGGLGLGDPATDLQPGWTLFEGRSRAAFREAAGYDDAAWLRGMGWVLSTALVALPYYWERWPAFAEKCRRSLAAVLADFG